MYLNVKYKILINPCSLTHIIFISSSESCGCELKPRLLNLSYLLKDLQSPCFNAQKAIHRREHSVDCLRQEQTKGETKTPMDSSLPRYCFLLEGLYR
jgi:hypothetical protein